MRPLTNQRYPIFYVLPASSTNWYWYWYFHGLCHCHCLCFCWAKGDIANAGIFQLWQIHFTNKFKQIHFMIWTNTYHNLDIFVYQIVTNEFNNLDKYHLPTPEISNSPPLPHLTLGEQKLILLLIFLWSRLCLNLCRCLCHCICHCLCHCLCFCPPLGSASPDCRWAKVDIAGAGVTNAIMQPPCLPPPQTTYNITMQSHMIFLCKWCIAMHLVLQSNVN